MLNRDVLNTVVRRFREHYGVPPQVAAYAPGRVEILGNHTDYNEGFVLSAAINYGTFFVASRAPGAECRIVAADIMKESRFDAGAVTRSATETWSNYVRGVVAGLGRVAPLPCGFHGMFLGNLPLGAGLSSSAALEMATGLALSSLYGMRVAPIAMAKIGQAAEHEFAGVKCGLLDQISSLHGRRDQLVMTDFRSLAVENVSIGPDATFLMCNTSVKHSLVDSEYNERRQSCEAAARFLAGKLAHPVAALRDVSIDELEEHRGVMSAVPARRAAHVIGENTRVLRGRELLAAGNVEEFGRLMFASHESSRVNFENSCRELDVIVKAAEGLPGVMGARLSGGGFGGSAVVLVHRRDAAVAGKALASAYTREFGHPCDVRSILPSEGASVVSVPA